MDYKQKYFKYKTKYLDLKNQIGGETNWRKINEEIEQLPSDKYQFLNKNGYLFYFKRLSDDTIFELVMLDYPNLLPTVKFLNKYFNRNQVKEILKIEEGDTREIELVDILNAFENHKNTLLSNETVANIVREQRSKQAKYALSISPKQPLIIPGSIKIS